MTDQQAYQSLIQEIQRSRRRLKRILFYRSFSAAFFYSSLALGITALILKITPWTLDGSLAASALIGGSLPASLILFWIRRISLKEAAILVDRRLRLKDKIASALELGAPQTVPPVEWEWRKALLEDALRVSRRLNLKRAFPWSHPWQARWVWAPMLVLGLTIFVLPQWDLMTHRGKAQASILDKKKVEQEIENLKQRHRLLENRIQEKETTVASQVSNEIKELADRLSKGKIEKREALSQIASLETQWEKQKEELENLLTASTSASNALQQKMTGDLAKELQKSDFSKAARLLQNIQKDLKLGSFSQEDQKRLASELNNLSQTMDGNASLAKSLENAAQSLDDNKLNSALQSLQLAEGNLSNLKNLQLQIALLDQSLSNLKESKLALSGALPAKGLIAACTNCQGAGCALCNGTGLSGSVGRESTFAATGRWRAGDPNSRNAGMGGPGIGEGGKAPFEESEFAFQPALLKGQWKQGPILGSLLVNGLPQKGESVIRLSEAFLQYRQAEEEALTKERVPLPYRYQVHSYFNALETSTARASGAAGSAQTPSKEE